MAYPTKSLPKVVECALCREQGAQVEYIKNTSQEESGQDLLSLSQGCEIVSIFKTIVLEKKINDSS